MIQIAWFLLRKEVPKLSIVYSKRGERRIIHTITLSVLKPGHIGIKTRSNPSNKIRMIAASMIHTHTLTHLTLTDKFQHIRSIGIDAIFYELP